MKDASCRASLAVEELDEACRRQHLAQPLARDEGA